MFSNDWIKLAVAVLLVLVILRLLRSKERFESPAPSDPVGINEWPFNRDYDLPLELDSADARAMYASMPPDAGLSSDLLPKPVVDVGSFADFAPTAALAGQQFLDPEKVIGIDTQGSSLRNASRDLRAEPPIPKADVGPWSQSTITADMYRKPLQ